jgi:hypothetical protein
LADKINLSWSSPSSARTRDLGVDRLLIERLDRIVLHAYKVIRRCEFFYDFSAKTHNVVIDKILNEFNKISAAGIQIHTVFGAECLGERFYVRGFIE